MGLLDLQTIAFCFTVYKLSGIRVAYIKFLTCPVGGLCPSSSGAQPQAWECQGPTYCSILAVPRTVLFWTRMLFLEFFGAISQVWGSLPIIFRLPRGPLLPLPSTCSLALHSALGIS